MTKRDWLLWAGLLTGPAIWFLSFGANFSLAGWACALRWKPALYVISLAAFMISAGSAWLAWGQWQQLGREYPGETGGAVARSRTMAIGGVAISALSCLLIVAQGIVESVLGACD
jgi:hypothetical protein